MPQIIDHIDAIARKKQRGVLFLEFHWQDSNCPSENDMDIDYDYNQGRLRKRIISWPKESCIAWQPCAEYCHENAIVPYMRQIYIDLPYDNNDPQYQRLASFLQKPDGPMRFDKVRFCFLPLRLAMKNSHQDKPGYWERWAANF